MFREQICIAGDWPQVCLWIWMDYIYAGDEKTIKRTVLFSASYAFLPVKYQSASLENWLQRWSTNSANNIQAGIHGGSRSAQTVVTWEGISLASYISHCWRRTTPISYHWQRLYPHLYPVGGGGDVLSIAQYHKHGGQSVVRSSRRRNRWLPRAQGECARVTAHIMFQSCHILARFVVSREFSIYQCLQWTPLPPLCACLPRHDDMTITRFLLFWCIVAQNVT